MRRALSLIALSALGVACSGKTILNGMGVKSAWFGVAEGGGGATMLGGVDEDLLA